MNIPDKAVEAAARHLALLDDGEAWPTNEELGGSLTGTRDDEFRAGMEDQARELLELVAPFMEAAVLHEQARTWGTTVDQYGRSIASHIHRDARVAEHGVGAT